MLKSSGSSTQDYSDSELTDDQNHFIAMILDQEILNNYNIIDLTYEYDNPKDILKGLEHFKKHEFVNKDEIDYRTNRKQNETTNEDTIIESNLY